MPKPKKSKGEESNEDKLDNYEEENDPELDDALIDGLPDEDSDGGLDGILGKLGADEVEDEFI